MFKGGYRDWSPEGKRRYWKFLAGLLVVLVVASAVGTSVGDGRGGRQTARATPNANPRIDPQYRKAAEDAGYRGYEAERIAREAEVLCKGAGERNC